MKQALNKNQSGLALGSVFAIFHTLWVFVVGIGLGKWVINKGYSIHFLANAPTINSFSFTTALIGIISAFVSGYIVGWLIVYFYNKF